MVAPCSQLPEPALAALLEPLGLVVCTLGADAEIPGSYWGAPEAGVVGRTVYVRGDTPVHSALHEAAHALCMDAERLARLHTDAGGDDREESAVCYLQALLAERLAGYGKAQLFTDMDAWGYSYRLGSAQAWFEQDASDALAWLRSERADLLAAFGCEAQT